jgi:hypothetical protein
MPKRTLDYEVPESAYVADLALLDKYQEYSAELLRLALALLVAYGFLLKEIVIPSGAKSAFFVCLRANHWWLIIGLSGIGVCAVTALAHRYLSSDGFGNEISYHRRIRRAAEENGNAATEQAAKAGADYAAMLRLYQASTWALRISAFALGTATMATALAFLRTILLC